MKETLSIDIGKYEVKIIRTKGDIEISVYLSDTYYKRSLSQEEIKEITYFLNKPL